MSTEAKHDLFKNPFLNVDKEEWEKWTNNEKRESSSMSKQIVFFIVSPKKDGPRSIIWIDMHGDENRYNFEDVLFKDYGWKEVFVWDTGSVELILDNGIPKLLVGYNEDIQTPNVFISGPFIKIIYDEISKVLIDFLDRGEEALWLNFDLMDGSYAVSQIEEPMDYRKKDE